MIIRTNDGRRIKCAQGHIGPAIGVGSGGLLEVWGKRWNERKDRWTTKNGLYYMQSYEVEPPPYRYTTTE